MVFLASDEAASVTGQVIGAGGDRLALWSHPAEAVVSFARRRLDRGRDRPGLDQGIRGAATGSRAEFPGAVLMSIDLTTVNAIDTHVHIESDGHGHCALDRELLDASAVYFRVTAIARRTSPRSRSTTANARSRP